MPPKNVKGEYIETETGNKISRRSQLQGTQNIILGGKTVIQAECAIRGDLHRTAAPATATSGAAGGATGSGGGGSSSSSNIALSIGRYSYLATSALLRPPSKLQRGAYAYYPLKIGEHVFIGADAVVEAAVLGSYVHVGRGAVIGRFAILKDYVKVLDGSVVPPGMVVPSFSVVGGRPARVVGEVPVGGLDGWDLREAYRKV
ncbi:MAG: hypothetical protein M1838_004366 [Thelocarpon superellum]|nr:MAG: hypothetical protein M1838_004366 [Thelocarpon superellum]